MTFDEFLEKCREKDGWRLDGRRIRNNANDCPLQAVFGFYGYGDKGRDEGLDVKAIAWAADGLDASSPYRKALLTLVKP